MLAGPVVAVALYALARGVPMKQIREATGLKRRDLLRLDARLPEQHMPALWRVLVAHLPGRAVPLEMATSVPLSFLGVLLQSLRYAGSLREALEHLVRFKTIFASRVEMRLLPEDLHTRLELEHPLDREDGGCASDFAIGLGVRYFRDTLGVQGALSRVELAHAPNGPPEAYRAFFAVPIEFHAERNAVIFKSAALDRPLSERNASALEMALVHLRQVSAHVQAGQPHPALAPILEAVRRNAEDGLYDVGALAKRLALTPRSLQRQLAAHGTTPRALIEAARASAAARLLREPGHSIEEIASRLGYSEAPSFRRAYRRWTGRWPRRAASVPS